MFPQTGPSAKIRSEVLSSGYGRRVPPPKEMPNQPLPPFVPDLSPSCRRREGVASSSYGKILPTPPKREEPALPTFQPDLSPRPPCGLLSMARLRRAFRRSPKGSKSVKYQLSAEEEARLVADEEARCKFEAERAQRKEADRLRRLKAEQRAQQELAKQETERQLGNANASKP